MPATDQVSDGRSAGHTANVTNERQRILSVARRTLGLDELRPLQIDAVSALLDGRDVLAVMATGYGKSAIFQTAAAMLDGLTVVVSPLIALQQDQVQSLEELDSPSAPVAVALNSQLSDAEREDVRDRLVAGDIDLLYLSPEQLVRDDVLAALADVGIALVAVDEAHCVSSWGHEFRPDYLRVGEAVTALGRPTVIALTATASPPVRDDIVEKLSLRDPVRLSGGFDRPEIRFEVRTHADEQATVDAAVEDASTLDGQGLVYIDTRAASESVAQTLTAAGRPAAAYHGGLKQDDRDRVAKDFATGGIDIVVATSAFGMGIDKPDIRFVVHAAAPGSVDAYYQEAGRCGRDGRAALARLHYYPGGLSMHRFFATRTVDESLIRRVVKALGSAGRALPLSGIKDRLKNKSRKLTMVINLLVESGALERTESGLVPVGDMSAKEAIAEARSLTEAEQKYARSRVDMMRGYAESTRCRRRHILEYFGEELGSPCGNCDMCSTGAESEDIPDGRFTLGDVVEHPDWGKGTVSAVESDRITVLFDDEGYKTLALSVIGDDLDKAG